LINWAIEHLPKKMIAIPGQHDLPYHSQVNLHESAFMTLVHAGVITKVGLGDMMFVTPLLRVHGFPFGEQVRPIAAKVDGTIDVALIHHYLWVMHHKYPGAPPESRASNWTKTLAGYDIAVFGDNHDGFTTRVGDCMVYNCGCLIQCKSDERHYKPSVGLLQDSGDIWRRYLDTSGNKWIDQPDEEKVDDDRLSSAIQELIGLDADSLDFREALRRTLDSMKDLRPGVKQVLMEIMEGQQ
jgi:predicted phosphodiesterase